MSLQDLKPQLSILGARTSEEGRKRELLFAIQASKLATDALLVCYQRLSSLMKLILALLFLPLLNFTIFKQILDF